MSVLDLVYHPNPMLREKSTAIEVFDSELKTLSKNMIETMHDSKGIGLAGVQIGILKRILVIDIGNLKIEPEDEDMEFVSNPEVFINPKILESSGEIVYEEGCLSIPGVNANIVRPSNLKVEYQNISGEKKIIETSGLKSIVIQHEIDHLDGILFPDHLSLMKKTMIWKKYSKLEKLKNE